MINFVRGHRFVGRVRSQFKMMRFELAQFLIIEPGYFCVVPGSEKCFIGGCEGSSIIMLEAAAAEGIVDLYLVGIWHFVGVVLAVDGGVVLGGAAQLEMARPLVHLLYLSKHPQ